jgi:hypothetical protein
MMNAMMMNRNVRVMVVPFLPRSMGVSGLLAVYVPIWRLRLSEAHTALLVVRWQIVYDHLWWLSRGQVQVLP